MALVAACLPAAAPTVVAPFVVRQIQLSRSIGTVYQCPSGKRLKVAYLNGTNGQSFALKLVQGVPTLLVSTLSADGVRSQPGFIM